MSLSGPLIASNKVVVFSWVRCPYCVKVKALLSSLTTATSYYDVDKMENGEAIHQEIIKAFNHETVPAVFIKGKFYGGFSDINEIHQRGELAPLLED